MMASQQFVEDDPQGEQIGTAVRLFVVFVTARNARNCSAAMYGNVPPTCDWSSRSSLERLKSSSSGRAAASSRMFEGLRSR